MPPKKKKDVSTPESELIQKVRDRFFKFFEEEPLLVRSPGRVNLIGEHTDYNEGFVLPASIDKAIYFAISPREDKKGFLFAQDLEQSYEFQIQNPTQSDLRWPNYLMGVVDQLRKMGQKLGGFNCVFGGDIPIGAGMSSSASIEAGLAFALDKIFNLRIDKLTLVKLAQKAEHEFVGVRCGIMDQFVNIFGRPMAVLKLDCRSLEYEYLPFERSDLRIVLCNTLVKRELASSEYNVRRHQCETGVKLLAKRAPGINSLRDVTPELLEAHRSEFDPILYKRCNYVVRENRRVEEACTDLKRNDFVSFGRLMNGSHDGLREDYEVSCLELDVLVNAARSVNGVLGARMMGAGFGGCTINLVEERSVDALKEKTIDFYKNRFGREPEIYVTGLRSGTEVVGS